MVEALGAVFAGVFGAGFAAALAFDFGLSSVCVSAVALTALISAFVSEPGSLIPLAAIDAMRFEVFSFSAISLFRLKRR